MQIHKDDNHFFKPDEISQPGDEDINPSDDNLDVESNDQELTGDEFDAMADDVLTHIDPDQLIDWMAAQLRGLKRWKETATKLMEAAATRQQKLEALRQVIVELTSQTLNQSTSN